VSASYGPLAHTLARRGFSRSLNTPRLTFWLRRFPVLRFREFLKDNFAHSDSIILIDVAQEADGTGIIDARIKIDDIHIHWMIEHDARFNRRIRFEDIVDFAFIPLTVVFENKKQ
jgi:hypothetical protein